MNNELSQFLITFTTQGLTEVKDGIDDLNKKLDGLQTGFDSASQGSDGLFAGLGILLARLGIFSGVLATVAAAITNAFNVQDRILDLNNMAAAAGVASEKIETLGIALQRYGGDTGVAGTTYKKITDLLTEYSQGKIPDNQREMMARYGFNIQPGMTPDQVLDVLRDAMYRRVQAGDYGGRNQIASAFGLDQSVALLLSQSAQDLTRALKSAEEKVVLSGEENRKNALALQEAKEQLKATWDSVSAELIPIITDVLEILKPIVQLLAPIASWAADQIGGLFNAGSTIYDWLTGKIDSDEVQKQLRNNNSSIVKAGVSAGDWLAKKLNTGSALDTYINVNALPAGVLEAVASTTGADAALLEQAVREMNYTNHPISTAAVAGTQNYDNRTYNNGSAVDVYVQGSNGKYSKATSITPNGDVLNLQPAMVATGVK